MSRPSEKVSAFCLDCGYSLQGITNSRCPECGRVFDPGDPRTTASGAKRGIRFIIDQHRGEMQVLLAGSIMVCLAMGSRDLLAAGNPFAAASWALAAAICILLLVLLLSYKGHVPRMTKKYRWVVSIVAIVTPIVFLTVLARVEKARESKRCSATLITIRSLCAEIDRVCERSDVAPTDETTLARLLGQPLPTSAWGDRIRYERMKNEVRHYRVWCLGGGMAGVIYEYDSRYRERGVVQCDF